MIPARLDFPCRTNADYVEEFSILNNGVPIDFTGYTASLTARMSVTSDVLFTLLTVSTDVEGIRFIESGVMSVRFDRETLSAAYDAAASHMGYGEIINIVHDIKMMEPTGDVIVWFEGLIPIKKGVGA